MGKDLISELKNDIDGFMHSIRSVAASIKPETLNQAKKFLKAREDGTWLKYIILQVAKEAIESDNPSERSKDSMSRNAKEFEVCIEQIISSCDGKCDKSAALGAIENAFLIAAFSPVSDRILNLIRRNQAATARGGNTVKAKDSNDKLDGAIKAEAKEQKRKLATSIEFARLIRPGVMKRLGLEPEKPKEETKWPSAGQIKVRIKAIKSANSSRADL